MTFTTHSMQEILPLVQDALHLQNKIALTVLNPDEATEYAGTKVVIEGKTYIYRSLKTWMDLAELLHCKMTLPRVSTFPMVTFEMVKLSTESFHESPKAHEKYGTSSVFAQVHKMEEASFFYYYDQALDNVNIAKRRRILNLGINRGDEFVVIRKKLESETFHDIQCVGVDHSTSAIDYAKARFPQKNMTFYTEDINAIDSLRLGRFDLLISIGTLQSPSIPFKPFFMKLVQEYLTSDAAIILGFPNSRWLGGEMIYGAKAPNYAMSEQSLLYNDVIFCKKYLQQKKYRVTITGKHYVFLTATKIQ